jgi:hypothetical protein
MIPLAGRTIEIFRPFPVVAEQVVGLGEAWLEDTVRTAASRAVALGGITPETGAAGINGVRVRVGHPSQDSDVFRLPMEWEAPGTILPDQLRADLEITPAERRAARIAATISAPRTLVPEQQTELVRVEEIADVAVRSFLRRLFWTLEALGHYDLSSLGARPK